MTLKKALHTALVATTFSTTALLTSCGGGGDENGDDSFTVRPKSMDGIRISFNGAFFEFTRGSSLIATADGETETGVISNYGRAGTANYTLESGAGLINYLWPTSIGTNVATYTYTAINDNSGTIRITVASVNNGSHADTGGVESTDYHHHILEDGESIILNIQFTDQGGIVGAPSSMTIIDAEESVPQYIYSTGSISNPPAPHVTVEATLTLVSTGGSVPVNYGDVNAPVESLSADSLDGKTIVFQDTDGLNNTHQFVLQFSATSTSAAAGSGIEEVGLAIYRDSANVVVTGAANYTYDKDPDTSIAILELSGGTPEDGTITLNFADLTYTSPSSGASRSFSVTE